MVRVACVDLPQLPLQVLLRGHPEWRTLPTAVIEEDKPLAAVLFVNRAARSEGIKIGMRYADALSLAPTLNASIVFPDEIRASLQSIVALLGAFTPEIEPCGFDKEALWLNVAGLAFLYESLVEWETSVLRVLEAAGWRARIVVGFGRFETYILAKSLRRSIVLANEDAERDSASRAPVGVLPLSFRAREILARLGVATIGAFLALPRESVMKRFGRETGRIFELASANVALPLQPVHLSEPVRAARRLDAPVADLELLAPHVDELLDRAAAIVARDALLVGSVELTLVSEEGERVDEVIRPSRPTLELRALRRLIRLRLSAPGGATGAPRRRAGEEDSAGEEGPIARIRGAVERIELRVVPAAAERRQDELFAGGAASARCRDLETGARAFALIRARFGNESVVRAALRDSHVPEERFAWEVIERPALPAPNDTAAGRPLRAVRRILLDPEPFAPDAGARHARPRTDAREHGAKPAPVDASARAFLLATRWWDRPVDREYRFLTTGRIIRWIYRDRASGESFLQGVVD